MSSKATSLVKMTSTAMHLPRARPDVGAVRGSIWLAVLFERRQPADASFRRVAAPVAADGDR
jgi:hypothetical protein